MYLKYMVFYVAKSGKNTVTGMMEMCVNGRISKAIFETKKAIEATNKFQDVVITNWKLLGFALRLNSQLNEN